MCTHLYKMEKKEMLTHYEFQKYLALTLIDPEGWGPHSENWRITVTKKGRVTAYTNEYQPVTREVQKPKAERINEKTLDPITGKLRNRIVYGDRITYAISLMYVTRRSLFVPYIDLHMQ